MLSIHVVWYFIANIVRADRRIDGFITVEHCSVYTFIIIHTCIHSAPGLGKGVMRRRAVCLYWAPYITYLLHITEKNRLFFLKKKNLVFRRVLNECETPRQTLADLKNVTSSFIRIEVKIIIVLIIPVISASADRALSELKLVENNLRSTLRLRKDLFHYYDCVRLTYPNLVQRCRCSQPWNILIGKT